VRHAVYFVFFQVVTAVPGKIPMYYLCERERTFVRERERERERAREREREREREGERARTGELGCVQILLQSP